MNTRLHLVIGFDTPKSAAVPTVIYCGRDATLARAAMDPEPAYAVKKWVRNPRGIRKMNAAWEPGTVAAHSSSLEVTAESTGSGEGDLSGEGGAGETGENTELTNHGDPVSTGEGDRAGGDQSEAASEGDPEPDLLSGAAPAESSAGSMTPRGRARR